ncbi:MAG: response regulator [Gammaproteobacteria bacterium]|nr:response regulator [Gammaproteobacteria bacterium]
MSTVLILDDQSVSRMILEELIQSISEDIQIKSFADPILALDWAKHNHHDLVITDYKMPNMDGVEFTHWLRQIPSSSDVPVVVITCMNEKMVRYRALEAGATDFLSKPFDHYECKARCRNLLKLRRQQAIIKDRAQWLEQEINQKTADIEQREKETLLRLARAGEYRDEETGIHVTRMSQYATLIAEELGFSESKCNTIRHAAPMHDIGKIGIPDRILLKPGKLDPEEIQTVQTHTTIGYEILRDSPSDYLQTGAIIALSHHERYDGNGYPNRMSGTSIPIEARVVTVADVFDALLSKRPYKRAWSIDQTIDYITEQRGRQMDPDCVDAFFIRLPDIITIHNQWPDQPKLMNY